MTSEPVREYQVLVGELKFHLPPQGDAAVSCVASAPEQCRVYLKLDRITMLTAYYDLRRQVQRLPPEYAKDQAEDVRAAYVRLAPSYPSNTLVAKEKSLPNTLSLFDAVPFRLVPALWLRVRFAT